MSLTSIEAKPGRLAEKLLTAVEVADLLAIPRSSVYEYARRRHRRLPSVSVGRHRRFIRRDVEQWLDEQCSSSP